MSGQFDLIDIVLFVNIAETSSLTQGADRSHISAPAASTRIKHIEARLGARLLDRTTRGVTLTPAGQAFLHHGRQFVNQLQNLQADLQGYSQCTKGYIRVFANTNAASEFLPSVLREYLTSHPNVNIDFRELPSHDIARAVKEGIADIGIIAGDAHTEGLEILPYRRDRLVLIVAFRHPLAKIHSVRFEATLDFDYIGLRDASPLQHFLCKTAGDLRRPMKFRIRVSDFEELSRMVETNVGIGIVPESTATRHRKTMAVHAVQLSNEWAGRDLNVCVRHQKELPSFARELLESIVADNNRTGFASSPPEPSRENADLVLHPEG
jgi:DNA-binding transcriptional LysR family regulator